MRGHASLLEKPRTTTGWKGLINDPGLDDSGDVNRGFLLARKLLLEVLELGLPVGCEWLDPITPAYISDLVALGCHVAKRADQAAVLGGVGKRGMYLPSSRGGGPGRSSVRTVQSLRP